MIDKSGPLTSWAANCAAEVVRQSILPDTAYEQFYLDAVLSQAKRAHRERKAEAAHVGHQAHAYLETYFKQPDALPSVESYTPEVVNCIDAALGWLAEQSFEKVAVEQRIYSRRHRYSGTLDVLARLNGTLCLLDWKSSKQVYPEYRLQTAAYVEAYHEEHGEQVEKRVLIRLGKDDGQFEAHEYSKELQESDFNTFLAALTLYKGLKDMR